MAKNKNSSELFPFACPEHLTFDMLYRYYFDFITRDVFQMFIFDGLPDTVDETFLKYCIFLNGKVIFFKLDGGELVALNGNYSDRPDLYYLPERMLVTNPRLEKTYEMKRDEECIVVYCSETDVYNQSDRFGGLYLLIAKTATMLADNDVSINVAQKNTRLINVLAAEDQNTKESIEAVIKKQYSGDPVAVVMKTLIDNVQSVPLISTTSNQYLVQLVELHQYILAHFYEAIGLSTHDNMKKERLITDEINDNDNLCKLNINNMLETIKKGLDKVNDKYGQNITIKLNPLLDATEPESEQKPEEPEQEQEPEEPEQEQEPEEPEQEQKAEEPESEQEPEEPEQKIEININVTDEAIADIVIDTGSDEIGKDVPEMGDDSGNDNESV